jgi:hypothetical protein
MFGNEGFLTENTSSWRREISSLRVWIEVLYTAGRVRGSPLTFLWFSRVFRRHVLIIKSVLGALSSYRRNSFNIYLASDGFQLGRVALVEWRHAIWEIQGPK